MGGGRFSDLTLTTAQAAGRKTTGRTGRRHWQKWQFPAVRARHPAASCCTSRAALAARYDSGVANQVANSIPGCAPKSLEFGPIRVF
jgi:hypothetical protein